MTKAAVALAAAAVLALVATAAAAACACADQPMSERLDQADAAVVGRIVSETTSELPGGGQARRLTVAVEQRVKGDVDETLVVLAPSGTDCDVDIALETTTGLLLTRQPDGEWFASACSLVTPGELVAAGGEPRGGPIKVAIGLVILALVLVWAFARLRRGARPELPGPPSA